MYYRKQQNINDDFPEYVCVANEKYLEKDFFFRYEKSTKEEYDKWIFSNDTQRRISELKQCLSDTDYQAIKYAEGELSEEEYTDMKAQRAAWRKEINELEAIV